MKRKIAAVVENHFDQLWRRCLEKDFESGGKNYVSYAKIEQYYIEENIKLCEKYPDYKFQIETPCAVDTYLKRFPEKKDLIKKLYKEGRLKTPNTGYLIVDSNMTGEETIIKNFLLGDKFFSEFSGETPKAACRSDAWAGSNGDWAALRWGGVEGEKKSVAIFNRGTPSYRILPREGGKDLALSLLRAPAVATYLHEPISYSMTDWDTMRDEGIHNLSWEMACYGTSFATGDVTRDAESFARPFLACKNEISGELPTVTHGNATVSHCKVAEDRSGIIARVIENGGEGGLVTLSVPSGVKEVYKTDMAEKTAEKLDFSDTLTLGLSAFEMATLKFVY